MFSRRGFLLLLGSTAPGLWLPDSGLIRLTDRFVLAFGGACSFCGKDAREVQKLAGVVGRAVRICDECIGLCLDILSEEKLIEERPDRQLPRAEEGYTVHSDEELLNLLRSLGESEEEILRIQKALAERPARPHHASSPLTTDAFKCSCCDVHRREVRKLISGPRVFICDSCVFEASALASHVLRPLSG